MADQITTVSQLEALYDKPSRNSLVKVAQHITPEYGAWIGASRFCILSTVGADGTDGSPAEMRVQLRGFKIRRPCLCLIGAATTVWIPCATLSRMDGCHLCSWCLGMLMWFASMVRPGPICQAWAISCRRKLWERRSNRHGSTALPMRKTGAPG